MCGIAGIVRFSHERVERRLIQSMTDAMSHRGPDADGFFMGDGIALGHRRLSIIDLSSAANQPFLDDAGRYAMVFNGEIYNYEEVKAKLPGYAFRTSSDTEALLAAYIRWGPGCLDHLRGMFSFAIWDRDEREIFLARDRLGVKPLYYYLDDKTLIFASEQRSILSTALVKRKLDTTAMLDFFSYQSVPFPHSAIEGIRQLQAGSWMKIRDGKPHTQVYWELTGHDVNFDFSDRKAVLGRTRDLMLQSVKRRLVSDVPVGAFLSGGIDSSAVVGLMAESGAGKPNTFNISFEEEEFDESSYAEMVAKKFNTQHTKIALRPTSFLEELENALNAMDSPSGDGVNTYVVSKAIRQSGMAVALSGVGGDELFAGYPYFRQFLQLQQRAWLWRLPSVVRKMAALGLRSSEGRVRQLLYADSGAIENAYPVFRQILSPSLLSDLTALNVGAQATALGHQLREKAPCLHKLPLLSQVSVAEYMGYTQHTLLKDTDQMSMAMSLEVREPFFDQDLVEFILAVPDDIKQSSYPKGLLVEALSPLLPDEIVFRKKQGFLFPWKIWLKNELRSFCEARIQNMSQRSFINGPRLNEYWARFLKGDERIRWAEIWLFVVLEYWMEKNNVE